MTLDANLKGECCFSNFWLERRVVLFIPREKRLIVGTLFGGKVKEG